MEDVYDESVLLSTMSPRFNKTTKKFSKKLSKLALKKQLRRSSIYDKLPCSNHKNVLISDSETTDTTSTSSLNSLKNIDYLKYCKNEILQETELETEKTKEKKYCKIQKWVAEVNAECNFRNEIRVESFNTLELTEVSAIYGENNKIMTTDKSNVNLAANSTFINESDGFRFDELFQMKTVNTLDIITEPKKSENDKCANATIVKDKRDARSVLKDKCASDIIIVDSDYDNHLIDTPIKTNNEISEQEKLLDELYGNSWRVNREKVLTPRNKVKVKQFSETEKKPKQSITYKNPYLLSEISKSTSLIRTLYTARIQKKQESPSHTRFKDLYDSESSIESRKTKPLKNIRTKLTFVNSDSDNDDEHFNLNSKNDTPEKFVNKTPRRIRNKDCDKENSINMKTHAIQCENESQSDSSEYSFKIESLEHKLRKTMSSVKPNKIDIKEKNRKYPLNKDTEVNSDKTRKNKKVSGLNTFNKELSQKDENGKNTNKHLDSKVCLDSLITDSKIKSWEEHFTKQIIENKANKNGADSSNSSEENGNFITNYKGIIKKSIKNNKTDFKKSEIRSKYFSDDSSPSGKLRNILFDLSENKKIDATSSVKNNDISKVQRHLLTEGRGKRTNLKKEIRYFDQSSDDSSDEYTVHIRNRNYVDQSKKCIGVPLSFLASLSGSVPIDKCDMSARIFRNSYKIHKMELSEKLFNLYNQNIFKNSIPKDTSLEWSDRLLGTAGSCYCRKITRSTGKIERSVRIVLSTKILDSADRLRDTLVHEMCHAATWIVNGATGHGHFWKAWASKAMTTFPELPPIQRCHNYKINTKYTYKCSGCGYCIGRHSKSLDIERKRCGYCYQKFEVFINKNTKTGQQMMPVTPKKEATGFALFVKENYSNVKTPNLNHGEVMRVLSKKFGELKTV